MSSLEQNNLIQKLHSFHRILGQSINRDFLLNTDQPLPRMDVLSAENAHSPCLDMELSQPSPPPLTHNKLESLDSATYLGSVSSNDHDQASAASFLQYVESNEFGGGLGGYPGAVYVSPSLYPNSTSPSATTFYDTSTYTGLQTNVTSPQSQLVSYAGSTFLIQPGPDGSTTPLITAVSRSPQDSIENSCGSPNPGHSMSYATRVSPITIQWLIANYETAEGVSLPRSTLYSHYLRHCNESKQDPVNAASFGKLIRSVFLGLRTRRIGTRGNSKYHYYGIRVKPSSTLNHLDVSSPRPPVAQKKKTSNTQKLGEQPDQSLQVSSTLGSSLSEYLGPAQGITLPSLAVNKEEIPPDLDPETITIFTDMYKKHLTRILDCVINLNFTEIEKIWTEFWHLSDAKDFDMLDLQQKPVSKEKLLQLFTLHKIQNYVQESDFVFYQALVDILIPDVLRPIPPTLTQAIRTFAKSLEPWMTCAMSDWSSEIKTIKLNTVRAFSQTLRRYTSLNHLAQAARAVLQNNQQITQMLADLNRVDFSNVQEQASWVCGCDSSLVLELEQDFKDTLSQQVSLECWAEWLEGVADRVLKAETKENIAAAAKQFLLRWSFYSSMIIRDLTLRSASSFGSFHLIRLLYDEFMFYTIEHKVATVLKTTPVAIMVASSPPPKKPWPVAPKDSVNSENLFKRSIPLIAEKSKPDMNLPSVLPTPGQTLRNAAENSKSPKTSAATNSTNLEDFTDDIFPKKVKYEYD